MPITLKILPLIVLGILCLPVSATGQDGVAQSLDEAKTQRLQSLIDYPPSLQTLAQATELDGKNSGWAGMPGQNYLAYQKAKKLGPESYPLLKELLPKATPLGQLYLIGLMRDIVPWRGAELLADRTSSEVKVPSQFGCFRGETTVGMIASKLLNPDSDFSFEYSSPWLQ